MLGAAIAESPPLLLLCRADVPDDVAFVGAVSTLHPLLLLPRCVTPRPDANATGPFPLLLREAKLGEPPLANVPKSALRGGAVVITYPDEDEAPDVGGAAPSRLLFSDDE